jgi:hypothetical protein
VYLSSNPDPGAQIRSAAAFVNPVSDYLVPDYCHLGSNWVLNAVPTSTIDSVPGPITPND